MKKLILMLALFASTTVLMAQDVKKCDGNDCQKHAQKQECPIKQMLADGKKPIIIVDGITQHATFDQLNLKPEQIGSLDVVKGEEAVQLYGDKAKDGAIVIKTSKDGKHCDKGVKHHECDKNAPKKDCCEEGKAPQKHECDKQNAKHECQNGGKHECENAGKAPQKHECDKKDAKHEGCEAGTCTKPVEEQCDKCKANAKK